MQRSSFLELFHPDGRANRALVIGRNCPALFTPESAEEYASYADLILLAPSEKECRTQGWLPSAAERLADALSPDGIAYVFAPPLWRINLIKDCNRLGLVVSQSFGHLPDWRSTQYLLPFSPNPARFIFDALISSPTWKRVFAIQAFRFHTTREMFASLWPYAGFILRRPGARPLYQWLIDLMGGSDSLKDLLLRTSWRGKDGAVYLYCFDSDHQQPFALAKVQRASKPAGSEVGEAEILRRMSPGIERAGAKPPRILSRIQTGAFSGTLQTIVPGQQVASLLRSNPDRLFQVFSKLIDWLEKWYLETVKMRPLDSQKLVTSLLKPMDFLMPKLEKGEAYRTWLIRRFQEAEGSLFPWPSAHNDLTMANILLDSDGELGIVDWETGREECWPLVDFYYAITDAMMCANGKMDRRQAVQACFSNGGEYHRHAQAWEARLIAAIHLSPRNADLCFQACWLHHAFNEQNVDLPLSAPRPFLKIVQWLANEHQDEKGAKTYAGIENAPERDWVGPSG